MRTFHKKPQRPYRDQHGTNKLTKLDQRVHKTVCGVDITAEWLKQGNTVPDGRVFEYWTWKRDKGAMPQEVEICPRCERLLALDDLASTNLDGDESDPRTVTIIPSGTGWVSY